MSTNNGSTLVALVAGNVMVVVQQPGKDSPLFWKLPGGRIKDGETSEQAAIRETMEETGIDLTEYKLILASKTRQVGNSGPYPQYLFLVAVPDRLLAGHRGKIVTRVDNEGTMYESTCFTLNDLETMADFLPKHLKMLRALKQAE